MHAERYVLFYLSLFNNYYTHIMLKVKVSEVNLEAGENFKRINLIKRDKKNMTHEMWGGRERGRLPSLTDRKEKVFI